MTKWVNETWSDEKPIPMLQIGVSRTPAPQHHLNFTLEQKCVFYALASGAARNCGHGNRAPQTPRCLLLRVSSQEDVISASADVNLHGER
jgi:hypothetical protein